jgi:AmiR/NasT family two-component response regulator
VFVIEWTYEKRVFLADAKPEERSTFRPLLLDLKMEVVGEAADWLTSFAQALESRTDMFLVDWDLLPRAQLLKNSTRPARPRWSLSSSAI